MASLPLSRGSTYSSSDSDESDADSAMLASCSLQEIRQEDLAAILPDQQEIDAFNDFECNRTDKHSPATGDMSGSDMELPQQAVNALIQRTTESSSEGETHAPPNPNSLYANSLLQQFVVQTQMLNTPCPPIPSVNDSLKPSVQPLSNADTQSSKTENDNIKRRRGRPKKSDKDAKNTEKSQEYCTNPNVSPDSGIQNSPDHVSSPEPTLSPNVKQKTGAPREEARKVGKSANKSDKTVTKTNTTVKTVINNVNLSKTKEMNKIPVTANRFDRVLYANADRVLYPPRRKPGRPATVRKGPGRPPKNRPVVVESVEAKLPEKTIEKPSRTPKTKHRTRTVLSVKNKLEIKSKFQTLKVPKLMHSKHKHKKHKKYKFKILKPITASDPKINIEIDKLVADFVKCCAIATKQPKENVPEQFLKTMKKVTKKRKTVEHAEKKKKKQSVNTTVNKVNNSNEQRLPLKKRHYHLVSSNENKNETEDIKVEPEDSTEIKNKIKPNLSSAKVDKVKTASSTPKSEAQKSPVATKYVPVIKINATSPKVSHLNNNEYEVKESSTKAVGSHIDEAIEACINRFADEKVSPNLVKVDEEKTEDKLNSSNGSITATTPKKRHRLEMANVSEKKTNSSIKTETNPIATEEKFMPQITIESYITELKAKRNLIPKSNAMEEKMVENVEVKEKVLVTDNEKNIVTSPESSKKKVRKRRAINRTGSYIFFFLIVTTNYLRVCGNMRSL